MTPNKGNRKTTIHGDRYKPGNQNRNRRLQDLCRNTASSGVSKERWDANCLDVGSDRTGANRTSTIDTQLP